MNKQILEVVDSVSMEKGVDKEIIFEALEEAISSATKKLTEDEANISVEINRDTGGYKTFRNWMIVAEEDLVDQIFEITEKDITDHVVEEGIATREIENIDFGRISAQAAKQVIIQKVREAERSKITEKYESLVGQVISGQVKRINRDFLLLEIEEDLNAQIPRDQIIPGEIFKLNEKVRAVIKEIITTPRGPQIILSRTDERLVVELFTQEVPEIYEGTIEIKAIARDPGYRSKIAVKTYDGRIDPVGACVGMRGSRVQAVSNEIGNERIDIFIHSDNPAEFVVNCLAPVKIYSIMVDERTSTLVLEVEEENQAQIIGKNGQNLRLMTHMIGWSFQVLNKEQFKEYQDSSLIEKYDQVASRLELSDKEKEQLVAAEMETLEKVVDSSPENLEKIFKTAKRTTEVTEKANELLLQDAFNEDFNDPTMEKDLVNLRGITNDVLSALSQNNIKSLEEFAEMSVPELMDISDKITEKEASALIMEARKPWFN
jgi:N utilization substance protein A